MREAILACCLFWAALIAGCSTVTSKPAAITGHAADLATTGAGLLLGATEANPLGVMLLGGKAIAYYRISNAPAVEQPAMWSAYSAVGWGATTNNLCVIAIIVSGGGAALMCPFIGVATGLAVWERDAPVRDKAMFLAVCADAKAKRPETACVYRPNQPES